MRDSDSKCGCVAAALQIFLRHCIQNLNFGMEIKEAMKQYCIGARLCPDAGLPETIYGCLPEQTAYVPHASLIHFKGASEKEEMNHAFARLTDKN